MDKKSNLNKDILKKHIAQQSFAYTRKRSHLLRESSAEQNLVNDARVIIILTQILHNTQKLIEHNTTENK